MSARKTHVLSNIHNSKHVQNKTLQKRTRPSFGDVYWGHQHVAITQYRLCWYMPVFVDWKTRLFTKLFVWMPFLCSELEQTQVCHNDSFGIWQIWQKFITEAPMAQALLWRRRSRQWWALSTSLWRARLPWDLLQLIFLRKLRKQVEQVEQVDTKKWEKTWYRHKVDRNVYSQKNNMTHLDIQNFWFNCLFVACGLFGCPLCQETGKTQAQWEHILYIFWYSLDCRQSLTSIPKSCLARIAAT